MIQEDAALVKSRVEKRAEEKGILPDTEAYNHLIKDEIQGTLNWTKMGAAITIERSRLTALY